MNIFILDPDPIRAARAQCDKHVVKMSTETAQMLSLVLPAAVSPYRRAHPNHPCSLWARAHRSNFDWLVSHGLALCDEYARRYGRVHAARRVVELCRVEGRTLVPVGSGARDAFVFCGPVEYMAGALSLGETGDDAVVLAYKLLYMGEKRRFARWRFPYAPPPAWWV